MTFPNAPEDIDFSPLRRALASLEDSHRAWSEEPANIYLRDSVVQRFEYTYEAAHAALRRFLAQTEADADEVRRMSFPALIRLGYLRGLLLSDLEEKWTAFRKMRNTSAHAYNEDAAQSVARGTPDFIAEARHLLAALESWKKRKNS